MTNKIRTIAILVISILFTIAALIVTFMKTERVTIENTTSFTATLVKIEEKQGKQRASLFLTVEEFRPKLVVYNDKMIYNYGYFINLPAGERIVFRVEDTALDYLSESDYVYIVSLSTDEYEIISLDDWNQNRNISDSKIHTTSIISAVITTLISIQCILVLNNTNVFAKIRNFSR